MADKKFLTKQSENFSEWYLDIVKNADLADYSVVKGCMIIKPYGYAIWERLRDELNSMILDRGVQNAYFPLFIPESFLKKEAEHVEGFAPEVALVTHAGKNKLEEPLVVRPTSETIMYDTYSKWIQSYRDLPLLINQWANVVRWEMKTKPFLRTTEFLWQEGHTAHATREDAEKETREASDMYRDLAERFLAIPVVQGKKSLAETFAGAEYTLSIEALAKDGKAIQAGTSHMLGQGFAKSFGIQYQDEKGAQQYVWQTSWGVSTRMVGVLIVVHGDDDGLVLPPNVAPYQAVVVPVYRKEEDKERVMKAVDSMKTDLTNKGIRLHIDDRDTVSIGFKINEWELKGVPVRIEIGPRDLENECALVARRDNKEKSSVKLDEISEAIPTLLDEIQENIYKTAQERLQTQVFSLDDYEEFKKMIDNEKGFYRMHWCGDAACEEKVKAETTATTRVQSFDEPEEEGTCIICGKPSKKRTYFAKAY